VRRIASAVDVQKREVQLQTPAGQRPGTKKKIVHVRMIYQADIIYPIQPDFEVAGTL
jgi:hypothetical protein